MSTKPIFVATHPRACSTAFERVFMTRTDILSCVHEPFGDAFYFGPERLSSRYEDDEKARDESGFAESTYKTVVERIEREHNESKRLFIKDIIHYLLPPDGKPATIAPSLTGSTIKKGVGTNGTTTNGEHAVTNGTNGFTNGTNGTNGTHGFTNGTNGFTNGTNGFTNGTNGTNGLTNGMHKTPYPYSTAVEPGNPTVIPAEILEQYHFTFLIRHPRYSIPSYWRCTIPPLDKITGFCDFMPSEAGYDELRRFFDFLRADKQVGPTIAGKHGELKDGEVSITVIDADDLLDNPERIIEAYCKEVGIDYSPQMLNWDTEEDHQRAKAAFEKWRGFHEDAIHSTSLRPRSAAHKHHTKTVEAEDQQWREKYGDKGQKIIRECVNANIADYEYLKSFAIKV